MSVGRPGSPASGEGPVALIAGYHEGALVAGFFRSRGAACAAAGRRRHGAGAQVFVAPTLPIRRSLPVHWPASIPLPQGVNRKNSIRKKRENGLRCDARVGVRPPARPRADLFPLLASAAAHLRLRLHHRGRRQKGAAGGARGAPPAGVVCNGGHRPSAAALAPAAAAQHPRRPGGVRQRQVCGARAGTWRNVRNVESSKRRAAISPPPRRDLPPRRVLPVCEPAHLLILLLLLLPPSLPPSRCRRYAAPRRS